MFFAAFPFTDVTPKGERRNGPRRRRHSLFGISCHSIAAAIPTASADTSYVGGHAPSRRTNMQGRMLGICAHWGAALSTSTCN
ncbi:hypothetical protein BD414DRAFT_500610 [Trametes punicea]|nr:hypothetical protein BD414DRAFT_500610 [Trametes punicea]